MLNMHEALGLVPRTQQQQQANEHSHYRQFVWFPKGKEKNQNDKKAVKMIKSTSVP